MTQWDWIVKEQSQTHADVNQELFRFNQGEERLPLRRLRKWMQIRSAPLSPRSTTCRTLNVSA